MLNRSTSARIIRISWGFFFYAAVSIPEFFFNLPNVAFIKLTTDKSLTQVLRDLNCSLVVIHNLNQNAFKKVL